jgi:GntR family transcriptional regulator
MNFNDNLSIYIQITEFVKEQILLNKWKKEDKIPSVRDLAVDLQVNPNTVMRAYDLLQQDGIINNRRGLGNYVSQDAAEKILVSRKERFLKSELPSFFKNLLLMDIKFEELERLYKKYVQENCKKN